MQPIPEYEWRPWLRHFLVPAWKLRGTDLYRLRLGHEDRKRALDCNVQSIHVPSGSMKQRAAAPGMVREEPPRAPCANH